MSMSGENLSNGWIKSSNPCGGKLLRLPTMMHGAAAN